MKRIITTGILGVVLTAIIYLMAVLVINRTYLSGKRAACWINSQYQRTGGQEYRICKDWKGSSDNDLLVIGSSHAYRGYDPRIFQRNGIDMYSAGSGFQNTLASFVLLENIFIPKKNDIVIIDLFDQTFEGDGVGSYARLIQNVTSYTAATELARRQPDIRTFNSLMCRIFSDQSRIEVPDEPGYLYNGYCPKNDTAVISSSEIRKIPSFNMSFVKYLKETIRLIKSQNAHPIAVSHPQPKTLTNETFHKEFLELVMPVLQEEGILYLDYNSNHNLNNSEHFADSNHLNQAGVELFNSKLISDMKEHGIIQ